MQGDLLAGEVCRALSGDILAIGLIYGEGQPEAATYLTEQFMHRFTEQNGVVRCTDISGFNSASANSGDEVE